MKAGSEKLPEEWQRLGMVGALTTGSRAHPVVISIQRHGAKAVELPLTPGQAEFALLRLAEAMAETGHDPLPLLRDWAADRKRKAAGYQAERPAA
jgi:hypothetical protein